MELLPELYHFLELGLTRAQKPVQMKNPPNFARPTSQCLAGRPLLLDPLPVALLAIDGFLC